MSVSFLSMFSNRWKDFELTARAKQLLEHPDMQKLVLTVSKVSRTAICWGVEGLMIGGVIAGGIICYIMKYERNISLRSDLQGIISIILNSMFIGAFLAGTAGALKTLFSIKKL